MVDARPSSATAPGATGMPAASPSTAAATRDRLAPLVLKLGGRALEAPGAEAELACAVGALGMPVVLVHGGGAEVSEWCARLGLETRFAGGLRVTDPRTLEVVAAVLAGLVNKRLVARLRAAGVDAIGLSIGDAGILDAEPYPDARRLGAAGRVRGARPERVRMLLREGLTPVFASVGAHAGELLNVNADEAAGALAASLGACELVLLSDVEGLLLDGARVPEVPVSTIPSLLDRADVRDGMRPKLEAAHRAVEGGAARAWIGAWQGPDTLAHMRAGSAPATVVVSRTEVPRVEPS